MLRLFYTKRPDHLLRSGLKAFCRFESDDLGLDDLKTIKSNKWPILKGEASAEKTKLVKSHYLNKRIVNTIPKYVTLYPK